MSENSKIEWTDHTFNPWIGCQKVGPGCDHCYAEAMMDHRMHKVQWGPGAARVRTSPANWHKPLAWNKAHAEFFAQHGRRQRVFCASLADVFDNAVDPQWRADLFELIEATPNLDWLLLTKRIGNVETMAKAAGGWPANAALGVTITSQAEANRDVIKALRVKAKLRPSYLFLSCEPLLSPLELRKLTAYDYEEDSMGAEVYPLHGIYAIPDCDWKAPKVDWVIVGGESGPGARPMHPEWARSLRDQCAAAGVPFLFKQWGEWTPGVNVISNTGTVDTAHLFDDKWIFGRENLASWGHADDEPDLYRVGKKAAGRLLDGVQHDGFPVPL